jgi:hypothetical protein
MEVNKETSRRRRTYSLSDHLATHVALPAAGRRSLSGPVDRLTKWGESGVRSCVTVMGEEAYAWMECSISPSYSSGSSGSVAFLRT